MKNKKLVNKILILLLTINIILLLTNKTVKALTIEDVEEKKIVYLTFDDGPSENTSKILDILKENCVNATFFMITPYIEPHNAIVKRAYDENNSIGNHTADHEYQHVYTSEENFFKTFNKQQDFIKSITGDDCTLFRFPGGTNNVLVRNSMGKDFTKKLTEKLNEQGINVYDWNVDSGDSKGNNIPPSTILNNVKKEIKDKDGNFKNPAIILMHDCLTKKTTVEALPSIIEYLKSEGYTFEVLK